MMSTDNEARQLRREITKVFYDIYTKAFMRSVEELVKPFTDHDDVFQFWVYGCGGAGGN